MFTAGSLLGVFSSANVGKELKNSSNTLRITGALALCGRLNFTSVIVLIFLVIYQLHYKMFAYRLIKSKRQCFKVLSDKLALSLGVCAPKWRLSWFGPRDTCFKNQG
jgi:hypothetical protein